MPSGSWRYRLLTMSGEPQPDGRRQTFEFLLNQAIIVGDRPTEFCGFGPRTRAAIDVVARAHPEAAADHIAFAFDAFHAEHG